MDSGTQSTTSNAPVQENVPASDATQPAPPTPAASPYRNWTGELMLNPSVAKVDEARLTIQARQCLRIFREAFAAGRSVSTTELANISLQYQSRLHELRRALIPAGWSIDLTKRGRNGINFYRAVQASRSTFVRRHHAKLQAEGVL